jgi:hypothetical protein
MGAVHWILVALACAAGYFAARFVDAIRKANRVIDAVPEWQVWDDEAEAGMTDEQVAMMRQGCALLTEEALTDEQALRIWQRIRDGIDADIEDRPLGIARYPRDGGRP